MTAGLEPMVAGFASKVAGFEPRVAGFEPMTAGLEPWAASCKAASPHSMHRHSPTRGTSAHHIRRICPSHLVRRSPQMVHRPPHVVHAICPRTDGMHQMWRRNLATLFNPARALEGDTPHGHH